MWTIIELISKNPQISVSSRNNPEMSEQSHYDFEFKKSNYPEEKNLKICLSQERPLWCLY